MAGKVELQGRIGTNDNMMPIKRWDENGRVQMSFMLWAESYTAAMEEMPDGTKKRKTTAYKVFIPNNAWGQKLWPHIQAGRQVLVTGRGGFNPREGQTRQGVKEIYANPFCSADTLLFLDEKATTSAKRIFNVLMSDFNLINDDQKDRFLKALNDHEGSLQRVVDLREPEPKEDPTPESSDPDELDIPNE